MPRRFNTEGHGGSGVVEVAEMLNVVPVAAARVERAGTLRVSRNGVRLQRVVGLQPLNTGDRLLVAGRAAVVDVVLARPDGHVVGINRTDRIVIRAVEA